MGLNLTITVTDAAVPNFFGALVQESIGLGIFFRLAVISQQGQVTTYALSAYPLQDRDRSEDRQAEIFGETLADEKLADCIRAIIHAPESSLTKEQKNLRAMLWDQGISVQQDGIDWPMPSPPSPPPSKPTKQPPRARPETPISGCKLGNMAVAIGYVELHGTLWTPLGDRQAVVAIDPKIAVAQINDAVAASTLCGITVLETIRGKKTTYALSARDAQRFVADLLSSKTRPK